MVGADSSKEISSLSVKVSGAIVVVVSHVSGSIGGLRESERPGSAGSGVGSKAGVVQVWRLKGLLQ